MRMEWVVIGVTIAIVVFVVQIFNNLVRLRNVVREGWSGIDVQLRRRTDLVPNLVETVKGYAAHERGLFEDVAKNRAQSIAADNVGGQAAAENALQGSLVRCSRWPRPIRISRPTRIFSSAAAARRGRGPAADGAALLQWRGAQPQHRHPVVSRRAAGAPLRLPGGAVLRARRPLTSRRPQVSLGGKS